MDSRNRAAVFIDRQGSGGRLKPYYAGLQALLGGLFRTAFFHDRVFDRASLPRPAHHHLTFRQKDAARPYDVLIYQWPGGDASYLETCGHLYPGIVICCGDYLPFRPGTETSPRWKKFGLEMVRQYGEEGGRALALLKAGRPGRFFHRHFPLYPSFFEKAAGVITFTAFEKNRIRKRFAGKPVIRVPVPVLPGSGTPRGAPKRGGLTVMCLQETDTGTLDDLLAVFSALKRQGRAIALVVPFGGENKALRKKMKQHQSAGDVLIPLDMTDRGKLRHFRQNSDIFLETGPPGTLAGYWRVVEALGSGRPVILADIPEYADFPDGICVKLDTGRDRKDMLIAGLALLDREEGLRKALAEQAAAYLSDAHHPSKTADRLRAFFQEERGALRGESSRRFKEAQEAYSAAAGALFRDMLTSLDIEGPPYLQSELVRMLRWGA
jgi:glycosyltransferase involved in cell wall biosynthesis